MQAVQDHKHAEYSSPLTCTEWRWLHLHWHILFWGSAGAHYTLVSPTAQYMGPVSLLRVGNSRWVMIDDMRAIYMLRCLRTDRGSLPFCYDISLVVDHRVLSTSGVHTAHVTAIRLGLVLVEKVADSSKWLGQELQSTTAHTRRYCICPIKRT